MNIQTQQEPAETSADSVVSPSDSPIVGSVSRAAQNVREWTAYLPKDCVDTMIAMGWDVST
jgi:hypothetical protein